MRYGSVCSGIEAASVAWGPLGWKAAWFSEIEPFPCKVLKHHYPDVPNLDDMTKLTENEVFNGTTIDVLVGGTPCQSFSIAGLRKGMADPRGNLALHFLKILDRARPRWVVWENVPGVISSWSDEESRPATADDYERAGTPDPGDGRRGRVAVQSNDLDTFLGGLSELGYGLAWRVLDAQHFGVPQRRRRIFVVGYIGDWRPAAAVLLESYCLSGNPPPSREAGKTVNAPIGARSTAGGFPGTDGACGGHVVACALNAHQDRQDPSQQTHVVHTLRGEGHDASEDGTGCGVPLVASPITSNYSKGTGVNDGPKGSPQNLIVEKSHVPCLLTMREGCDGGGKGPLIQEDKSAALATGNNQVLIVPGKSEVFDMRGNGDGNTVPTITGDHAGRLTDFTPIVFEPGLAKREGTHIYEDGVAGTVRAEPGDNAQAVDFPQNSGSEVRRLTPRECERLQGFPDDYTLIPIGGGALQGRPQLQSVGKQHGGAGNAVDRR